MGVNGIISAYLCGNTDRARLEARNTLFIRIAMALTHEYDYDFETAITITRDIKPGNCFTNGL